MKLRAVVTGTGRSGTGWASRAITSAGWPCAHENVFTLTGIVQGDYVAASSWLAAPVLDHPAVQGATVVHVVREPLACIRSLAHVLYSVQSTYTEYARRYIGGDPSEPFHWQAARHYIEWNNLIDAHVRLRAEDGPEPLLAAIGLVTDRPIDNNPRYNHRTTDAFPRFTWADFPTDLADSVRALAAEYGY